MTQPNQPINSGAPLPVSGVTGGPGVLAGQIANDPGTGNVVINPNPGNAVEVKKSPSQFNVYEYFNTNTDFARLALATALGGPEVIGVQAQPGSVNRDLQIVASGSGHVTIPALQLQFGSIVSSANTALTAGGYVPIPGSTQTLTAGVYLLMAEGSFTGTVNTALGLIIAPTTTGTSGAPNILSILGSGAALVGTAVGNAYTSIQGIATVAAGTYQLMATASLAINFAQGRWSWIKIG